MDSDTDEDDLDVAEDATAIHGPDVSTTGGGETSRGSSPKAPDPDTAPAS